MLSTGTDEVENMPFDWMVGGEAITVLAPGSLVNSNSLFDSNITGWTATGCTAVHSTTFVHPDHQAPGSLRLTPDEAGTTDSVTYAQTGVGPVAPGCPIRSDERRGGDEVRIKCGTGCAREL